MEHRQIRVRLLLIPALIAASLNACSSARAPVDQRGDDRAARAGEPEQSASAGAPDAAPPAAHEVRRGDTLYSIAWRYGLDYRDVARWNGIREPYVIFPRQRLRLQRDGVPVHASPRPVPQQQAATPARETAGTPGPVTPRPSLTGGTLRWQWPTAGHIMRSDSPTSRKGVDIVGEKGQPVKAAAAGAVVYSGSGLLGYGRLIIVKHSDTFLSAYAYNEQLLVAEGDQVSAGQQIATMGTDNDGRSVLHFEIRKDGKPVNPLDHLPPEPRAGRT
jgi:lipoprotein NlpD